MAMTEPVVLTTGEAVGRLRSRRRAADFFNGLLGDLRVIPVECSQINERDSIVPRVPPNTLSRTKEVVRVAHQFVVGLLGNDAVRQSEGRTELIVALQISKNG